MIKNTDRRWVSVPAACEYFGLKSVKTLYSLAARGRLPVGSVLRLGRAVRIDILAIEAGQIQEKGAGRKK